MIPSAEIEEFVHDLLETYPVTQRSTGIYLQVTVTHHQLVLEEVERNQLMRMAYYLTDPDGTDVADPEILFYIGHGDWVPIQITRYLGGQTVYATVDTREITALDATGQEDLAAYADLLAHHYRRIFLGSSATDHASVGVAPWQISETMQELVEQLACKYGVDLTAPDACLRLQMEDRPACWVIQRVNEHISVARYAHPDDPTPDPDLIFLPTAAGWTPVDLIYSWDTWRAYVLWALQTGYPICDVPRDMLFAHFTEYWARQLHEQGWIQSAQCLPTDTSAISPTAEPTAWPTPTASMPDMETLMTWMDEGGCEATDSCWVECDGVCAHGHPSWLLVAELI